MRKTEVRISVSMLREGSAFIAHTPVLDLATSGKSVEEAQSRFEEAVQIFFEETLKRGTLDTALQELGWKKVRNQWKPPFTALVARREAHFLVDLSF